MAKQECGPEILELQKQMEELRSQQSAQQKGEDQPVEEGDTAGMNSVTNGETLRLNGKIEELAELLQQDLKQVPTTTVIAIFALGVLMGRLISK